MDVRSTAVSEAHDSCETIIRLLRDAEALLKTPHMALGFSRRRVNTSLALLAVQGLISYFEGNDVRAADDLGTAADEIRARFDNR